LLSRGAPITFPNDRARPAPLANARSAAYVRRMFVVTEADAAAIRDIFERDGEFAAGIEVRRRFGGIVDNGTAREQARKCRTDHRRIDG